MNEVMRAYINYLKLEKVINQKYALVPIEIKLLNELAIASGESRELRVSDLIAMREIGSPATLHAALQRLLSRELIFHIPQADSRIKLVNLTEKGWERFYEISASLV